MPRQCDVHGACQLPACLLKWDRHVIGHGNLRQASNRTPAFAAHCVAVAVSDYLPVHFLSSRSSGAHGFESVESVSDYLPVKKVKILMGFCRFWRENVTKPRFFSIGLKLAKPNRRQRDTLCGGGVFCIFEVAAFYRLL